ncbi:MAG: hypothetical protein HOQ11_01040 [Gemmatimonadaceae bacterium]|nr:hypothetical protein [Gemmatimonadaceae bacterium]NUQ91446.1 hypothetical protein [Gemmatimonadaceae bacterium]NUR20284.1 hypothetical protein [Gemmatimonadaceae bacterium]NUS95973.1 hypothetical protein [Gemmatimonadaceae bacterium]
MLPKAIRRLTRASRKNEIAWRYGYNLGPTLSHHLHRARLAGEASRVLADLNRDGIAVTSVDALLGGSSLFPDLLGAVGSIQRERADDIARARANAVDDSAIGQKTFLMEYLGRNPVLEPDSIFARFALQAPLLDVANAYLGMYTRMRYYNVWHTFASTGKARESQLWHRDREDLFIMKVFVYLSDVTPGAGPFTYAPRTHRRGVVRRDPEFFLEGKVKRTDDDQMSAVVPRERWITGTGVKGTIIFADTNGYHKGGLARETDRLMYTCMYTSQASESEEFFVRPETIAVRGGDPRAFALSR